MSAASITKRIIAAVLVSVGVGFGSGDAWGQVAQTGDLKPGSCVVTDEGRLQCNPLAKMMDLYCRGGDLNGNGFIDYGDFDRMISHATNSANAKLSQPEYYTAFGEDAPAEFQNLSPNDAGKFYFRNNRRSRGASDPETFNVFDSNSDPYLRALSVESVTAMTQNMADIVKQSKTLCDKGRVVSENPASALGTLSISRGAQPTTVRFGDKFSFRVIVDSDVLEPDGTGQNARLVPITRGGSAPRVSKLTTTFNNPTGINGFTETRTSYVVEVPYKKMYLIARSLPQFDGAGLLQMTAQDLLYQLKEQQAEISPDNSTRSNEWFVKYIKNRPYVMQDEIRKLSNGKTRRTLHIYYISQNTSGANRNTMLIDWTISEDSDNGAAPMEGIFGDTDAVLTLLGDDRGLLQKYRALYGNVLSLNEMVDYFENTGSAFPGEPSTTTTPNLMGMRAGFWLDSWGSETDPARLRQKQLEEPPLYGFQPRSSKRFVPDGLKRAGVDYKGPFKAGTFWFNNTTSAPYKFYRFVRLDKGRRYMATVPRVTDEKSASAVCAWNVTDPSGVVLVDRRSASEPFSVPDSASGVESYIEARLNFTVNNERCEYSSIQVKALDQAPTVNPEGFSGNALNDKQPWSGSVAVADADGVSAVSFIVPKALEDAGFGYEEGDGSYQISLSDPAPAGNHQVIVRVTDRFGARRDVPLMFNVKDLVCHPENEPNPHFGADGDVCKPSCGVLATDEGQIAKWASSCPAGYQDRSADTYQKPSSSGRCCISTAQYSKPTRDGVLEAKVDQASAQVGCTSGYTLALRENNTTAVCRKSSTEEGIPYCWLGALWVDYLSTSNNDKCVWQPFGGQVILGINCPPGFEARHISGADKCEKTTTSYQIPGDRVDVSTENEAKVRCPAGFEIQKSETAAWCRVRQ